MNQAIRASSAKEKETHQLHISLIKYPSSKMENSCKDLHSNPMLARSLMGSAAKTRTPSDVKDKNGGTKRRAKPAPKPPAAKKAKK